MLWSVICYVTSFSCITLSIITPCSLPHKYSKKVTESLQKQGQYLFKSCASTQTHCPGRCCMQTGTGERGMREQDLHKLESLCVCLTSAALQGSPLDSTLDPNTLWWSNPLNTISVLISLECKPLCFVHGMCSLHTRNFYLSKHSETIFLLISARVAKTPQNFHLQKALQANYLPEMSKPLFLLACVN